MPMRLTKIGVRNAFLSWHSNFVPSIYDCCSNSDWHFLKNKLRPFFVFLLLFYLLCFCFLYFPYILPIFCLIFWRYGMYLENGMSQKILKRRHVLKIELKIQKTNSIWEQTFNLTIENIMVINWTHATVEMENSFYFRKIYRSILGFNFTCHCSSWKI